MFRAIVRLVFEETKEVRTFIPSPENARAKIVTRGNSTSSTSTAEMIATIATVTGSRRTFVRFFFPEATARVSGVSFPRAPTLGGALVSTDIKNPIFTGCPHIFEAGFPALGAPISGRTDQEREKGGDNAGTC